MRKITFRPAAEFELQEAHDWYEQRESALGDRFMACIADAVDTIRRHPEAHPIVHRHMRQSVLRRFPYSILYFTIGDEIIVVSVFHSSRNPVIWQRRQ